MSVNATVEGVLGIQEKFSRALVLCLVICYNTSVIGLHSSSRALVCAQVQYTPVTKKVLAPWESGRVKVDCNLSLYPLILLDNSEVLDCWH